MSQVGTAPRTKCSGPPCNRQRPQQKQQTDADRNLPARRRWAHGPGMHRPDLRILSAYFRPVSRGWGWSGSNAFGHQFPLATVVQSIDIDFWQPIAYEGRSWRGLEAVNLFSPVDARARTAPSVIAFNSCAGSLHQP